MSLQKLGAITTHTTISVSLFIIIAGVIYFMGGLSTKVEAMEAQKSPTRAEFDNLKDSINTLNGNLQTLNNYLLNNNIVKK